MRIKRIEKRQFISREFLAFRVIKFLILFLSILSLFWIGTKGLGVYYQFRGALIFDNIKQDLPSNSPARFFCESPNLPAKSSRGQAAQAIDYLQRSLEYFPNAPQTHYLLGQSHCIINDLENAQYHLETYSNLKPNNPLGYLELGFVYEGLCRDLGPQGPTSDIIFPALCQNDEWTSQIRNTWENGGVTPADLLAAGLEAQRSDQSELARLWFGRALILDHHWGEPWYQLGLLYEKEGQGELAVQLYKEAIDGSDSDRVNKSSFYYRIGRIYHRQIDPPQLNLALEAYTAAISFEDFRSRAEMAEAYFNRGDVYRRLHGNPEEYIPDFMEAILINDKHAWAHASLGRALYDRDGDLDLTIFHFNKALEISPNSKLIHFNFGEIYRQANMLDEAKSQYLEALKIDPGFSEARLRLEELNKTQD